MAKSIEREDDSRLLTGCISGHRETQDAFVRRFSSLVYSAVQHTVRLRHFSVPLSEIEDLHNNVFVRLFEKRCKKLRQYRGENGCSLASWIRLVAVRTVLDHIRKARTDALALQERLVPLEDILSAGAENPEPWALMDHKEEARVLLDGLRALSVRDRLFLKLHCMQGLSIAQVAGILKVTEANAYSLKHRAIKRLKAKIAEQMPGLEAKGSSGKTGLEGRCT